MSIRHITGRNVAFIEEQLRDIEKAWAEMSIEAKCQLPEYRRDKVLADILSLKLDVSSLAEAFLKYEDIREQYDDLRQAFADMADHQLILMRLVAVLLKEKKKAAPK